MLFAVLALTVGLIMLSSAYPGKFIKFDPGAQDGGDPGVPAATTSRASHPIERVEAAVSIVEKHLEERREDRFGIKSLYSVYDQDDAFSIVIRSNRATKAVRRDQELIEKAQDGLPEIVIGKPSFKWDQTRAPWAASASACS